VDVTLVSRILNDVRHIHSAAEGGGQADSMFNACTSYCLEQCLFDAYM
jgi:hypothetical protein